MGDPHHGRVTGNGPSRVGWVLGRPAPRHHVRVFVDWNCLGVHRWVLALDTPDKREYQETRSHTGKKSQGRTFSVNIAASSSPTMTKGVEGRSMLRTMFLVTGTAASLVPIAVWFFGLPGLCLVIGFFSATIFSQWLSIRCATIFTRAGRSVASVLAASGIRMAVLLILALLMVLLARQYGPVQSVLLVVPLYLSMIFAELVPPRVRRLTDTGSGRPPLPTGGSMLGRQG